MVDMYRATRTYAYLFKGLHVFLPLVKRPANGYNLIFSLFHVSSLLCPLMLMAVWSDPNVVFQFFVICAAFGLFLGSVIFMFYVVNQKFMDVINFKFSYMMKNIFKYMVYINIRERNVVNSMITPEHIQDVYNWCSDNCNGTYAIFTDKLYYPETMTMCIIFSSKSDLIRFRMVNG